MGHGIMKGIDKGVVHGDTWHRLTEYKTQDFPVKREQAIEVLDYPLEKRQLFRVDASGNKVAAQAWEIIRTDTDTPLAPHVGADFTVMNNRVLFDFIASTVLDEFPDIDIESVGTLFGGATAFVNLNVGEFVVNGDKSKSISRLMYYNPLGKGKYKVCAHNVRVVCNNTLRMATNEAIASGLLHMVSHTKNAETNIKAAMGEILALRQSFLEEKELMEVLAKFGMTSTRIEKFFKEWLPIDEKEATDRLKTRRANLIQGIMNQFESDQQLSAETAKSAYGLLNAITYWYDHEVPNRGNDKASVAWDGIVGGRSDVKVEALYTLKQLALA